MQTCGLHFYAHRKACMLCCEPHVFWSKWRVVASTLLSWYRLASRQSHGEVTPPCAEEGAIGWRLCCTSLALLSTIPCVLVPFSPHALSFVQRGSQMVRHASAATGVHRGTGGFPCGGRGSGTSVCGRCHVQLSPPRWEMMGGTWEGFSRRGGLPLLKCLREDCMPPCASPTHTLPSGTDRPIG
jgi:hypothetical protein